MQKLTLLFLIFISSFAVCAESDYRDMSWEEINEALTFEEIDELSFRFVLEKMYPEIFSEHDVDINILILEPLSKLMYFYDKNTAIDIDLNNAIKKFQRDLDKQQTGELTFGEYNELYIRALEFSPKRISLGTWGDHLDIEKSDDRVFVQGTWLTDNDRSVNPINQAKIVCYQNARQCIVVEVSYGKFEDDDIIFIDNFYEIISWNSNEITAQLTNAVTCEQKTMTINSNTNEVFILTRSYQAESLFCSEYRSDSPTVSILEPNGQKRSRDYWESLEKENNNKFYNTDYTSEMNRISEMLE